MTTEDQHPDVTPSKKDRLRPVELVGFSAVLAVFATLVVMLATKDFRLAAIVLILVFIISLMVVALIGLGIKPNPEDIEARKSIEDPDAEDSPGGDNGTNTPQQ